MRRFRLEAKINLMLIFGGQSEEHEVSLKSFVSVFKNVDLEKYNIYCVGITKNGNWFLFEGDISQLEQDTWLENSKRIVFPPDPFYKGFYLTDNPSEIFPIDVVFPVVHGPKAEDGTLQGLFELANIPYVGCKVTSSALCMDKFFAKEILRINSILCCDYMLVYRQDFIDNREVTIAKIKAKFNYPVFVKPANLGSSVGISKAVDDESLIRALGEAAKFDRKLIVEEFIDCREIECSVLGDQNPIASIPGEIIPSNEFYDYDAKYKNKDSRYFIPASLSEAKKREVMDMSIKTYKALDCSGMARIDFFLEKTTENLYVSEINTLPGFTEISMFPKLLEATGITYSEIIESLISSALQSVEKGN